MKNEARIWTLNPTSSSLPGENRRRAILSLTSFWRVLYCAVLTGISLVTAPAACAQTITQGPSCASPSDGTPQIICAWIGPYGTSQGVLQAVRLNSAGQVTAYAYYAGEYLMGNPSCATRHAKGQIVCAARGANGALFALSFDPAQPNTPSWIPLPSAFNFSGNLQLDAQFQSDPSCASTNDGTGQVTCGAAWGLVPNDPSLTLVAYRFDPTTGQYWGPLVLNSASIGTTIGNPSCASNNDGTGQVTCAVKNAALALYGIRFDPNPNPKSVFSSGFQPLNGFVLNDPSCASPNDGSGQVICAAEGEGPNNATNWLYGIRFDPATNYSSNYQSLGGYVPGDPSCTDGAGEIICGTKGGATTAPYSLYSIQFNPSTNGNTSPTTSYSSGFLPLGGSIPSNLSCAGTGDGTSVLCAYGKPGQQMVSVTQIPSAPAALTFTNPSYGSQLPSSGLYSYGASAFIDFDGTTRVWSCGGEAYYPYYVNPPADTIIAYTPGDAIYYYPPTFQASEVVLGFSSAYSTPTASRACSPSVVHGNDGSYRMFFECSAPYVYPYPNLPPGQTHGVVTQSSVCTATSGNGQAWSVWMGDGIWTPTSSSGSNAAALAIIPTTTLANICNAEAPGSKCPYGIGYPSAITVDSEIWIYYYADPTNPSAPPANPGATNSFTPPCAGITGPVMYRARTYDGVNAFAVDCTNLTAPYVYRVYALDTYRGGFFLATTGVSAISPNPDFPPEGNYAVLSADGLNFEPPSHAHPLAATPLPPTPPVMIRYPAVVSNPFGHVPLNGPTNTVTLISSQDECPDPNNAALCALDYNLLYNLDHPLGGSPSQQLWPIVGTVRW